MKKSVVYLSAFVMFIAVLAMSVGFSAAWFANVTESSSPILIGADNGTAYVTIDTSQSNVSGAMRPAILNDGYLLSDSYNAQEVDNVLPADGTEIDSNVFKSAAEKATYNTSFTFDGQPNISTNKRKVYISIEGVYLVEPTESNNGQIIPKPNLDLYTNYINYVNYGLKATYIEKVEGKDTEKTCTVIGEDKGNNMVLAIQSPIKHPVKITGEFYFNKADELLPSELVNQNLYILMKIHALEGNSGKN